MSPDKVNRLLISNLTSGYLNPAQMKKKAAQSVNEAINAALADIRGSTRAAQLQATNQARAYEGFGKAIGGMRTADAAADQRLYQSAADAQARYAANLTGSVGDAADASAAAQQRDIAAIGGDPATMQRLNPEAMRNVGNYLGGVLPAGTLAGNAVATAVDTRNQGVASAERLGLEGAAMRQKTLDLQKDLALARTKLTSGRPAAMREAMDQIGDDQRSNLATLANVLYLQNTQAKTASEVGINEADTWTDAKGITRNYDSSKFQVKYRPNGAQYLVPLPGTGSGKNAQGLTPGQVATANRARATALKSNRANMLTLLNNKSGSLWKQPPALLAGVQAPTRKSYSTARKYLVDNYAADLIKQYPKYRTEILRQVDQVLASSGWVKVPAKPRGSATQGYPGHY
jgi:hypothetical protein